MKRGGGTSGAQSLIAGFPPGQLLAQVIVDPGRVDGGVPGDVLGGLQIMPAKSQFSLPPLS
jgi:hypothetical protein